jgi:hypothetical protein
VRSSAAPGLGARGEPCSGEQAGRLGQCEGRQAQGGRGEGLEALSRHGIEAGHRDHRRGTHGGAAVGSASREARDRGPFMVGTGGGGKALPYAPRQPGHGMGTAWPRGAATCGGRSSQWRLDVRAPASVGTPRGTGLGAWCASPLLSNSAHGTGLEPAVP